MWKQVQIEHFFFLLQTFSESNEQNKNSEIPLNEFYFFVQSYEIHIFTIWKQVHLFALGNSTIKTDLL